MNNFEEVKKILNRLNEDGRYDEAVIDADAGEICRLFEKDKETVKLPQVVGGGNEANDEPKPYEELGDFVGDKVAITHSEADRLLTDEEILEIQKGVAPLHKAPAGWNKVFILTGKAVAKSQDAKTVERILKWGIQPCLEHNTGGGVFTRRECPKCWKELTKRG